VAKFIVRRVLLMLLTMLIVSVTVFLITEASPGNVARNVLGIHITPEQEASFLHRPASTVLCLSATSTG
jgi:peptide/nickel transport system permease protein